MIQIPERILKEQREFRKKVEAFQKGELAEADFKAYRGSLGVYEQRTKGTYMLRTRIPSGVITLEQLREIIVLADRYGAGRIHFTTRQDIQFHDVKLEELPDLMEALLAVELTTRGSGGNTARNIVASPLTGVDPEEVFDVLPYAEAATNYLLQDPTAFTLPRKYKIAFSNTAKDTANATIADLGFIAREYQGQRGFALYGGGGLGANSSAAILLEEFIPAHEVLYHVQAMKELFEREGDRSNRNKARIRYILFRVGEEAFRALYREIVEQVKREKDLSLVLENEEDGSKPAGLREKAPRDLNSPLVIAEKTAGSYSLYAHPQSGNLGTEPLQRTVAFLEGLPYQVTLRLTNTQGFLVQHVREAHVADLLDLLSQFTSPYKLDQSIACSGARICQLGLCSSPHLLAAIGQRFENAPARVRGALPRLYISGCPNSCGQHQIGEIGFAGKAKKITGGLIPVYNFFVGGKTELTGASLGKAAGEIPARRLPDFLYALATLKAEAAGDFQTFLNGNREAVEGLLETYGRLTDEEQEDALFYDFGASERFSTQR